MCQIPESGRGFLAAFLIPRVSSRRFLFSFFFFSCPPIYGVYYLDRSPVLRLPAKGEAKKDKIHEMRERGRRGGPVVNLFPGMHSPVTRYPQVLLHSRNEEEKKKNLRIFTFDVSYIAS